MENFIKWIQMAVTAVGLAVASQAAEPFVVPAEVSPPFRRDALPIDADTMSSLSRHLTRIARVGQMDSPPARRAVAQALALAIALDPESSHASELLTEIAAGDTPSKPEDEKINRARTSIWQVFTWLSSPEAGRDGNLLADLLGDTASFLDPGNPAADSLRGSLEKGKWDGWVAPVTAFDKPKLVIPKTIAKTDPLPPENTDTGLSSTLKPSSTSIKTVLYDNQAKTDSYILGPVTVRMDAKPPKEESEHAEGDQKEGDHDDRRLRIMVSAHETVREELNNKVSTVIVNALEKVHEVNQSRLPKGEINIRTGSADIYSFRRNGDDMTGPGFILANSAITGIAPDAIFIGKLDRDGDKLDVPDFFWKKLATLISGTGGRLVVPAAAEEYFTALLAVEKPEFFMKYEVLVASSPKEAIRLCAMKPDPEIAAALAKFKEIKDKAGSTALGSYLANSFVRKRLVEISQAAPYHLSAKLLAIQGAGSRPRALDKKILAAEIFEAIDPIHDYAKIELWEFNAQTVAGMESGYETSYAHLQRLERYAEMRDRELVKSAQDVLADLRAMSRIIRDRREMWEKGEDITRAQREFRNADREFRNELAELSGDPLPKEDP